ncbi:MAG: Gldg family protein [Butyricimonas paravirosa]
MRVLERESGEKTFLRIFRGLTDASEAEITAAMKRLAMTLPTVGVVTGRGERNIHQTGDVIHSFGVIGISVMLDEPRFDEEISLDNEIRGYYILLLAEMRSPFTLEQRVNWEKYVARGGNLIILSEPNRGEVMDCVG